MENIIQKAGNVKLPVPSKREFDAVSKRKKGSEITAFTYEKTNLPDKDRKAFKLRLCGKTLVYAENPAGGDPILISAMRCGLRFCPSCAWKRTHQIFHNVYNVITSREFSGKQFIFITLTIKNCKSEFLENEIKRLLNGWQKLTEGKRNDGFSKSFLGTFRALEVTYNKLTGKYHPHLHAMAAVDPDYFRKSNKHYIGHERLIKLWRKACDLDYDPAVRIQRVKETKGKQVAEVAKYTVKSADYLNRPTVLETLDPALKSKRLIAYGGLFRAVKKRLVLQDEEEMNEFPRLAVEELLRNPYIKKIALDWNMGNYHLRLIDPPADPTEWLDPGRLAAESLKRQAAAWSQEV